MKQYGAKSLATLNNYLSHCRDMFCGFKNELIKIPTCNTKVHALLAPISPQEIFRSMNNFKSKAPGYTGLSPINLKEVSAHLVHPLAIVYSHVMQSGKFPNKWLDSSLFFIHKKAPALIQKTSGRYQ